MKVLVADDSQPIRERLVERLSCLPDVQIAEAVDTPDALRQTATFMPDVAVLDIRMPGGGGLKALSEIKKLKPDTTVIIMTNYPYAQYRRKCLETGADFFFDKSSEFEQVAETIRQLMQSVNVGEVAFRAVATQLVVAKEELEKAAQRRNDMSILNLLHKPARDITDQAYVMWEKTFDAMPDLLAIFDADHRIIRVNKALSDRLGIPAAELSGKKCFEYIHGTHHPPDGCPHQAMLQDGQEHTAELYEERLGGWFTICVSPIYGNGKLIGAVHVAHDITRRKQAEMAVRHALDIAEEANCTKTQFLANMSHELRTPLNAIIGFTELLEDSTLDDEQRDYVRMIGASGENLLSIIADLLDFSKIEMGKLEIKKESFCIRNAIEELMLPLSAAAAEKRLELSATVAENVPGMIGGDVSRLRQVLINLLNNAIKFTDKGFVKLTVRSRSVPSGSRRIEFTVEDSGAGMEASILKRIFQPFQLGDNSSTREHGGAGLGLAISKKLVEIMGGAIHVESCEGKGSVFKFHIVNQVEPEIHVPVGKVREKWQGRCICVWTDDPADMRTAEHLLERCGSVPRYKVNTEEIKNSLTSELPADVVLCNLDLPGLAEKLPEFRKVRPDIPWIAFSNWNEPLNKQIKSCFVAFIDRPLKPDHLYKALAKLAADMPGIL
ncbi:MAG: ATP-binding protein [Kiritimatiellales bacterium]